MKRIFLLLALSVCSLSAFAGVPSSWRINIPDVEGYYTMKCDFHLHTVFSDAKVWPEERVIEAAGEGLDAIAITDHITKTIGYGREKFFGCDQDAGVDLAIAEGARQGVIVIRGGEITRKMDPGHWNTLFLTSVNDMQVNDENGQFAEARRQNAFIYWNHPDWQDQAPNVTAWHARQQELYEQGYMMGIEIFNQNICPEAFQWAIEKDLTMMSGTDAHQPIYRYVDYEHGYQRPVTLVFTKERTEESIHEALLDKRTAVYADRQVWGREEILAPLAKAIIDVRYEPVDEKHCRVWLTNKSSIPLHFLKAPGSEQIRYIRDFDLNPGDCWDFYLVCIEGDTLYRDNGKAYMNVEIENFHTSPTTNLRLALPLE